MPSHRSQARLKLKSADQLYISPNGRWLASSKTQGRMHLYDLDTRAEVLSTKPLKNIDGLMFSPCSRYLSVINDYKQWCVLGVPDGQLLLQGQSRAGQSVFQSLNFLPDGSGLFTLGKYTRLDRSGPQPHWLDEREASCWRWPDGVLQGTRALTQPFTTTQVHADYPRGRYWLPHSLGVPIGSGNSTTAGGLIVWQGDVLSADFTTVPPPPQAAMPAGHPGEGLWKNIQDMSLAPDGGAAVLLGPGYRINTYDLLLLRGQSQQTQAFATLCSFEHHHAINCALGQGVVAVHMFTRSDMDDAHIAFYARADLRPLGRLMLPKRASVAPQAIVWHPSGLGLGLAMGANSVYHFDCPQQPEPLLEWLAAR